MNKNLLAFIVSVTIFIFLVSAGLFYYDASREFRLPEGLSAKEEPPPPPPKKLEEKIEEEVSNQIFIDAYRISKQLKTENEQFYIKPLIGANSIAEALEAWKMQDNLEAQKKVEFIDAISEIQARCNEIDFCLADIEFQYFLSTLNQITETADKKETLPLWKSIQDYNYFDAEKRAHLTPELRQKLASVVALHYARILEIKNVQEKLCPQVKPALRTPAPYQVLCGEKAQKLIKNIHKKIEKREKIDLNSEVCLEFVELVVQKPADFDPRMKHDPFPCPEMQAEYERFRIKFFGLEPVVVTEEETDKSQIPNSKSQTEEEEKVQNEGLKESAPKKEVLEISGEVEMEEARELEAEPLEMQEESEKIETP